MKSLLVEFGKSTSQNYPHAVELASRYDTYEESGEGKFIKHVTTFTPEQIMDFFDLYELVGRWKSCSIYIDGELVPPNKLHFLRCFQERLKAYDKNEYCYGRDDGYNSNDNDFGCRHTNIQLYGWQGLRGYGAMDRQGVFHVNKDKLRHDIYKNIETYQLCPALSVDVIERGVNEVPERVNPKRDRDWEYVTEYEDGKEIAVAVRKKGEKSGAVIKDHAYEMKIDLSEISSARQTSKSTGCLLILGLPLIIYSVYNLLA